MTERLQQSLDSANEALQSSVKSQNGKDEQYTNLLILGILRKIVFNRFQCIFTKELFEMVVPKCFHRLKEGVHVAASRRTATKGAGRGSSTAGWTAATKSPLFGGFGASRGRNDWARFLVTTWERQFLEEWTFYNPNLTMLLDSISLGYWTFLLKPGHCWSAQGLEIGSGSNRGASRAFAETPGATAVGDESHQVRNATWVNLNWSCHELCGSFLFKPKYLFYS